MFNRRIALGLTAAAAVVTLGATAAPAFAGGTPPPTPYPTPTQLSTTPPPVVHHHRARISQEDIEIRITENSATAQATGPVRFTNANDVTVSQVLDRLVQGPNSVRIRHEPLGGIAIDRQTCSITVDQNDQPWFFQGGTGVDRFALGAGLYTIRGIFSFPTRHFRCTLPSSLTVSEATYDLNSSNGGGLPNPVELTLQVQATGWATTHPFFVRGPVPVSPYELPTAQVTVDP
jgi:hypothetical protein